MKAPSIVSTNTSSNVSNNFLSNLKAFTANYFGAQESKQRKRKPKSAKRDHSQP